MKMAKKGKSKEGNRISANCSIRTNYVSVIMNNYDKFKIDETQKNSKCRLCGEKDDTFNHIVRECSKPA